VKRFLSMPVAASLALLTACQMAPDLIAPSGKSSLKVAGGGRAPIQCVKDFLGNCNPIPDEPSPPAAKPPSKSTKSSAAPCEKDFWGNCSQPTAALLQSLIAPSPPPPPAAQKPSPKGTRAAAGPCQKDFWGNCAPPATALLPPSIIPPTIIPPAIIAPTPPPPGPPEKSPDNQAAPCQKDFWGNCAQMIPTLLAPPAKEPPQEDKGAKGNCVRDFWGNCTPVASSRHAYRWRYVRPGKRNAAATPSPQPSSDAGGGGGGGGRVQAAPSLVCHAKRRVVGEEQPTTEQAQLSAEQAWMGSVRHDYGERYQNLAMARHVRYTCAPSSHSSGLKQAMYRCATEAVPCRTAGN
jgi:hypothetical protein